MKNSIIYLLLICSSTAYSMGQWHEENVERMRKGIAHYIQEGSKIVPGDNGVLRVYRRLHDRLQKDQPHHLTSALLAHGFLTHISHHDRYQTALRVAINCTRASQKSNDVDDVGKSNKAWDLFRKEAAHLLAETIEMRSTLKFNRKQEDAIKLFEMNKGIDPDSNDGECLEAGTLALYGLKEVQENEKDRMAKNVRMPNEVVIEE